MDYILLGVLAAMILLLVSQNRKRRKEAEKLLASIVEGSKVMLHSGIKGTITAIDGDDLILETTPGVKLAVVKQAVRSVEAATEGN
ncbi:MAG: preprotein translocase subunit YajC [Actinobacteria bacterium]|nr:preprotein translocase subunit YajC [Actinomycetota bacterium]